MRTTQVAVVGGGPAGLSAAIATARAGAKTVLLDEHPQLGGQLRYRIAVLDAGPYGSLRAPILAHRLIADADAAGVDIRADATVWGLFDEKVLAVVEGDSSYQLQAASVILATGSTDRPLPFPGGTLPGVFTARALQILLNLYRVQPGRRVVLLGDGTEADEVAADIALAGGSVVARVTIDRLPGFSAQGAGGVEFVTIGDERYEADVVTIAAGRQPDSELALMAECAAGYAEALGGWTPIRDRHLQTTTPGIFVCGDAAGTCEVGIALAEGELAGIAAAATLDLVDPGSVHRARTAYEAAAASRIHVAESLTPDYVQVERVSSEAGV